MAASWADAYPTLADMKQHAAYIVRGTVTGVAGHGQTDNHDTTTDLSHIVKVPYTDFVVMVTSSMKGQLAPGPITIRQTGGPTDSGQVVHLDDDPLLQVGDDDVLFLREYSPGHYVILGGPTGRFPIKDGKQITVLPDSAITTRPPTDLAAFTAAVAH